MKWIPHFRESVETFLAHNYDDVAARFVALSFLWELLDPHLWESLDQEYGTIKKFETTQRLGFRQILKDLIRLVDPQQLTDPKVIAWEIVNACSVANWDLAIELYKCLKQFAGLTESQFRAVRGQFLFVSTDWEQNWSKPEHTYGQLSYWSPELLEVNAPLAVVMCVRAWVPPWRQNQPDKDQLVRYSDSANDLKIAIGDDPALPVYLHLMWAKSSLLIKDYLEAGKRYEAVLKENLWKGVLGESEPCRQMLYESAADSYEKAGRPEEVQRLLQACLEELPQSKGIWLKLARLHTQPPEPDYKAAYESLCRENEVDPRAGEDIRMSVALALGGVGSDIHRISRVVESYLAENTQQLELTQALIQANWSDFMALTEASRTEWLQASWMLWGLATQVPGQSVESLNRSAAQKSGL